MKRETLLPAILTTMILLAIGVVAAMVVLGRQNPAPPAMPAADLPVSASTPKEKSKPPVPQKEKPKRETRATREKPKEEESKEAVPKPKEEPPQAANPEPAQPPEVKPTDQGKAGKSEEKPVKPETTANKENTPQQTPQPDSPPVPIETPPAAKEPPTPAPPTQPEQQPAPPVAPPPATTQQPTQPVTPTVAAQTTSPPSEEDASKTLAELQTAMPPQLPADQAQSALAELPSVGQLTVNLWFADTQESWDAANNAQLDAGERYAHCGTSGTVTAIVRDATAPVQPVIDTQVIISASTISIKTPCPQISVTYEREGYLPVERQYSANSPNQAVADDIVMKSLTVK